jgi:CDP-6-deoxy-D-xylo-4-hexulose-3-dehydrase
MNQIRWDSSEIGAMRQVLMDDWFGYGESNKKLEKKLSEFTEIKHVNLSSSGSSAILVAVKALMHEGRLKSGDLVLHPITTFPTSIASAIDFGIVPVFVETKPNTYVIDAEQVEEMIKKYPEIKGAIIPHLLGNIPEMDRIVRALNGRFLIEDSCDTLGGQFDGKHVGSNADFVAFSFYGSHHISTAGIGGALATNNLRLAEVARSMIFWGRDFNLENTFMNRYKYATIGTNSQMSALQAAFGLAQMERLGDYIKARKNQFDELYAIFKKYDNWFELPESHVKANPSWFAFPLVVKNSAPFTREDFVKYLTDHKIEIRPIMCGNILKQPPYSKIKCILSKEEFPIGDKIESRGLFIPAWGMPEDQKKHYHELVSTFLDKYRLCPD